MRKLIVGLGNPGKQYERTRHNIGYIFLNEFKTKNVQLKSEFIIPLIHEWVYKNDYQAEIVEYQISETKITLMKPQTFMNQSGVAVSSFIQMYKLNPLRDLVVVHDDLDIKLGEYKIQLGKGPKLHNGIESIEKSIGTKDFMRVRIGVDNRDPENRMNGEDYVLKKFSQEEMKRLPLNKIGEELERLVFFNSY